MVIFRRNLNFINIVCLCLYYCVARYLPSSTMFFVGKYCKWIRYQLCKRIFKYCGQNVNIERNAFFGTGVNLEIGDNSGLGINSVVPSNIKIGTNVMMGPNCYVLGGNHAYGRVDIPMIQQGMASDDNIQTIIEDDVWIGRNVTMTPGRHILQGSIIGACCLLCKDFPEYSIVGGNPSKLIRRRI